MRGAHKAGLVGARCEINASSEAGVEKTSVKLRITGERRVAVAHGFIGKKDAEHRAALRDLDGESFRARRAQYGVANLSAKRVESRIGIEFFEEPQARD